MHQRCTTLDERGPSVADLVPSRERLSEEPKKKSITIRPPTFLVTLSRSEGSVALGRGMLRRVYPECNEWAQHDRDVHQPRHRHLRGGLAATCPNI